MTAARSDKGLEKTAGRLSKKKSERVRRSKKDLSLQTDVQEWLKIAVRGFDQIPWSLRFALLPFFAHQVIDASDALMEYFMVGQTLVLSAPSLKKRAQLMTQQQATLDSLASSFIPAVKAYSFSKSIVLYKNFVNDLEGLIPPHASEHEKSALKAELAPVFDPLNSKIANLQKDLVSFITNSLIQSPEVWFIEKGWFPQKLPVVSVACGAQVDAKATMDGKLIRDLLKNPVPAVDLALKFFEAVDQAAFGKAAFIFSELQATYQPDEIVMNFFQAWLLEKMGQVSLARSLWLAQLAKLPVAFPAALKELIGAVLVNEALAAGNGAVALQACGLLQVKEKKEPKPKGESS
jgi:hypothetical protein